MNIDEKLNYFIKKKKIPNILFHGANMSGKRNTVFNFIKKIYKDKQEIKKYVMFVNCAHAKGIKFIREELKFFAKCNINNNYGNFFKSIILSNADKLTIDAQSALRRCIELFSHTTRFFIIVEDKNKLLRPIISRFCEIHFSKVDIKEKCNNINLTYINNNIKTLKNLKEPTTNVVKTTDKFYEKAITANDIIDYIYKYFSDSEEKYRILIITQKVKKEFRNEKLLIFFILNLIVSSSSINYQDILSL